ncbi:MAG: 4-hydroxy-tetrahydrodipicolinate synthase [SAR202 cluster bacterium]|jgi:4-hydroxy-tetrahydrodipicolinate synthase|nr:4-hydroxy-tetrahydrodipicolinate synthase [SAR202 cluster bacterium]
MAEQIGRLLTAMITPFDSDGKVDYPQARRLALALVASGSDGVVVAGTTGESPSLTREEQARLFEEIKEALDGKGDVVAGTGSNSTAEAIEYTQDAQKIGADAVLSVVPYYNKPPQEGLYQHFKAIAESTNLPVILYNVPGRTATNMNTETVVRLSEIPNILGIKEAGGDLNQAAHIIQEARPGFLVWSGNDDQTYPIMAMGGYGIVSVASHLIGDQIKAMMGMTLEGDLERAAAEHRRLLPMFQGLFVVANPIPVKYAVNKVGFSVGEPRLPLVSPDAQTAAQIDALIKSYKVDLPIPAAT